MRYIPGHVAIVVVRWTAVTALCEPYNRKKTIRNTICESLLKLSCSMIKLYRTIFLSLTRVPFLTYFHLPSLSPPQSVQYRIPSTFKIEYITPLEKKKKNRFFAKPRFGYSDFYARVVLKMQIFCPLLSIRNIFKILSLSI